MNDQETLEALRELRDSAKRNAQESQEYIDALTMQHTLRLEALAKAESRYVEHLEMMAARVSA